MMMMSFKLVRRGMSLGRFTLGWDSTRRPLFHWGARWLLHVDFDTQAMVECLGTILVYIWPSVTNSSASNLLQVLNAPNAMLCISSVNHSQIHVSRTQSATSLMGSYRTP